MTPSEISKLYTRLLTASDHVLRRPTFEAGRERLLNALREEIVSAVAAPAEQRLMFQHEVMLCDALLMLELGRKFNSIDAAMAGAQVAGVLHPWVQEHAAAAIVAAHQAVATSDGAGGQRR